jgi:hypothetical protein
MKPAPYLAGLLLACLAFSFTNRLGPMVNAVAAETASPAPANAASSDLFPPSIDLRPSLDQRGLTPRRQGARPTCSVFTMAGAIEFAVACRQGHVARLSIEFLNWAGNEVIHERQDGGFFSDLWKGFITYGLCPEEACPYQPKFDTNWAPKPDLLTNARPLLALGLRLNWIKEWDVQTGLMAAQIVDIKRTLSRGWPVCGGFRWPKQAKWEQSVLQLCPADAVYDGHSLLLVGYRNDADQPGGGVFLFRNTSADGRDGAMPYAYAQAYMNDAAWVDYSMAAGNHVQDAR